MNYDMETLAAFGCLLVICLYSMTLGQPGSSELASAISGGFLGYLKGKGG